MNATAGVQYLRARPRLIKGIQLVLLVAQLLLGPFGLPSWAPLAAVLAVLVIIARRQQGSR